jgi:hypothetical protein
MFGGSMTAFERRALLRLRSKLPPALNERLVDLNYDSLRYTARFWIKNAPAGWHWYDHTIHECDWLGDAAIALLCLEVP